MFKFFCFLCDTLYTRKCTILRVLWHDFRKAHTTPVKSQNTPITPESSFISLLSQFPPQPLEATNVLIFFTCVNFTCSRSSRHGIIKYVVLCKDFFPWAQFWDSLMCFCVLEVHSVIAEAYSTGEYTIMYLSIFLLRYTGAVPSPGC